MHINHRYGTYKIWQSEGIGKPGQTEWTVKTGQTGRSKATVSN